MLRLVLLGLLIPLGVGVLSAMELRTPPRSAGAIVQPQPPAGPTLAEPNADNSDSHDALAKGDRLEVAAASSDTPEPAVLTDEGTAQPDDAGIAPSEPPRPIARHRHNPKSKKVATAARPKSEPKAPLIKRSATSPRLEAAGDTEPCRLKAFGGLRKALNSDDCEI